MTAGARWLAIVGVASLAMSSAIVLLWRHAASPARPAELPLENLALALGWGSFASTTLDAAPLNQDHTLSLRFMAAYDASYRGVIVADESGSYHLGMAPYASLGRPALELCVGGATFTFPLPDAVLTDNDFRDGPPRPRHHRWRRLALSRRGAAIVVAYDGAVVGSFEAGAQAATGRLRLGRLAQPSYGSQDQFYGLVDDLLLWSPALDDSTLARSTAAIDASAASTGAPPRARLDFDAPSPGRTASFSLEGTARLTAVSRDHRAASDEHRLPEPRHQVRLELPFLPGQVWMPIQGIDSALSHHDVAAFAIDFIRIDPRFVSDNPRRVPGGSHGASQAQPVVAPAPGRVVALIDSHTDDDGSAGNFVCLQHQPREVSCLLHVQAGAETREAAEVRRGDALARVGKSGAATVHLHFALSDLPEPQAPDPSYPLVTIPAAFSDYLASTDFGRSWHHVERGVPAPGEWVRRAGTSH